MYAAASFELGPRCLCDSSRTALRPEIAMPHFIPASLLQQRDVLRMLDTLAVKSRARDYRENRKPAATLTLLRPHQLRGHGAIPPEQ